MTKRASRRRGARVKRTQLGMTSAAANYKLLRDLLYHFVVTTGQNDCFKCGKPMTRETFSIEHIIPWLHSENPVDLFFNMGNISYSHLKCNIAAARRGKQTKKPKTL